MMISLILPSYNCFPETANALPELVKRLVYLNFSFEIILVDDHSENPENYQKLAAANNCIYIRNEKNHGKGFSVKRGFQQSRGSILIFMDGDFPFEMDVIDRMIEAFKDEETDIVIGDRSLEGSSFPATPPLRNMGSHILSFLATRLITPGFSDTQCGVKGFRRKAAESLFSVALISGFSFDMEILFIAIRNGFIIKKIPVKANPQNRSNVRVLYHGMEMIFNIGRIYSRKWKGRYKL